MLSHLCGYGLRGCSQPQRGACGVRARQRDVTFRDPDGQGEVLEMKMFGENSQVVRNPRVVVDQFPPVSLHAPKGNHRKSRGRRGTALSPKHGAEGP